MADQQIHFLYNIEEDDDNYNWSATNEELIRTLKDVYRGKLHEDSPRATQPDGFIHIQLKSHQLTAIKGMQDIEDSQERLFHKYNVGVLADPVGSGKSYSLLGHLLARPRVLRMWENYTNERHHAAFCGFECVPSHRYIPCNLIVVSHSIYSQWSNYLQNTSLKTMKIGRKTDFSNLDRENFFGRLEGENFQVILIKANLWNDFKEFCLEDDSCIQIQRNEVLVRALDRVPSHPNVYRDDVKNLLRQMKNTVKEWRIDSMITSRLSNLMVERRNIDNSLNEIEEMIRQIRIAPERHHFEAVIDAFRNFGDKYLLETVNTVQTAIMWERIIVDEVDTINISASQFMSAKYYWMLTNNIENLMFPSGIGYYEGKVLQDMFHRDPSCQEYIPKNASGFHRKGFFRNIWEQMEFSHYYRQVKKVFLRNDFEYVQNSFLQELAKPIYYRYWMQAPYELRLIHDIIPNNEVIQNLQAGNWSGALQILSHETTITATQEDFMKKIREEFVRKTDGLKEELPKIQDRIQAIEMKQEYHRRQIARKETELAQIIPERFPEEYSERVEDLIREEGILRNLEERRIRFVSSKNEILQQTEHLVRQIEVLEERVRESLSSSHCAICLESYHQPTACVNCCGNMFCLECILEWMTKNGRCPLCRKVIDNSNISILEERWIQNHSPNPIFELPEIITLETNSASQIISNEYSVDKCQIIYKLLTELMGRPETKILLYSEHDESFSEKILPWMRQNGMEYEMLSGNGGSIDSRLKQFREGKKRILLLNARHFGCGINLQNATDLILFHRMNEPLERQILGRAQRYGRVNALRVHSLLYRELEEPSNLYQ